MKVRTKMIKYIIPFLFMLTILNAENITQDNENLQETESAVFCSWYCPFTQAVHTSEVVVHSVPAAHCLHETEVAESCS